MKKFFILFIVVVLSTVGFSQTNLENQFYLRGGFSTPSWSYYGANDKNDFSDSLGNIPKRLGGVFELGSIFMINSLDISDGLRLGINVDYLTVVYTRFKYDQLAELEQFHNLYIGSKVGPSLTYNPVNMLAFDVFAKINPVWLSAFGYEHDDFESNDDVYLGYVQMKYAFGINVRYSILIVGFEYNLGSHKLQNDDNDGGSYLGNMTDDGDKSSMPYYNFTIGLSF